MSTSTRPMVQLIRISSWTRILTKSTERNRSVVSKLGKTKIPDLSVKYASLRGRLVGAKMAELRTLQHVASPQFTTATSPQLFAGFNFPEPWPEELPMEPNFGHGTIGHSQFGF